MTTTILMFVGFVAFCAMCLINVFVITGIIRRAIVKLSQSDRPL
jgi:hypothetical protein